MTTSHIETHGSMAEINERKQLESDLCRRDLQESLLAAINHFDLQVVVIESGRIIYVNNHEVAREFGFSGDELAAGPALVDIVHPDDRKRAMDYYARRLAGEDVPTWYELGLITRSGERREYEVSIAILRDVEPNRVIAIGKDITERKRLEIYLDRRSRELRANGSLLQSVLESSPDIVVFALDRDYRYLTFNSKHRTIMRSIWGREIALGMNMLDVIGNHPDRETAKRSFDRVLAGESFVTEEAYGDEAHSRRYWRIYWSPILESNSKIVGATCFVLDITSQKQT